MRWKRLVVFHLLCQTSGEKCMVVAGRVSHLVFTQAEIRSFFSPFSRITGAFSVFPQQLSVHVFFVFVAGGGQPSFLIEIFVIRTI